MMRHLYFRFKGPLLFIDALMSSTHLSLYCYSDYLRTGIVAEKPENYNRYMRILLHCEDIQQEADIRLYDKHDAQLKYSIDTERYERGHSMSNLSES